MIGTPVVDCLTRETCGSCGRNRPQNRQPRVRSADRIQNHLFVNTGRMGLVPLIQLGRINGREGVHGPRVVEPSGVGGRQRVARRPCRHKARRRRTGPCRRASGLRRTPRAVANAQDHDLIPRHAVANDGWADAQPFPHAGPRHGAAAVRQSCQAIAGLDQPGSQFIGRYRVELCKIRPNGPDIGERERGPDDPQRCFGVGQGCSSGFPQDCSHFTTSACGTTRPAA